MTIATYSARRDRARALMLERGLDTLIVSRAPNRFYLSGFELHDGQCNESSGWLVLTAKGEDHILTDARFLGAACRLWPKERVFIYANPRLAGITEYLRSLNPGRIGFDQRCLSVETFEGLRQGLDLLPAAGLVEELRLIKDEAEIAALTRSCALNHKVFRAAQEVLHPGMSEMELSWEVEKFFREGGATELSFQTIAAVGPNGALPHAVPGQDKIREDSPVLIDAGGRVDGYCSDQTRTFWVGGKPTDIFLRTRDLVREAQEAAIRILRPGLTAREAYAAAYGYFESKGVAPYFTHSLGHGIGLETHEGPGLGPNSETVLTPGMVVTVEPGLYYGEWGGVRWEFMTVITEDGVKVL